MGYFFIPRKCTLLFLIISASLLTVTSAGRRSKSLNNEYSSAEPEQLGGAYEESSMEADAAEVTTVHERLLRMNAHDYGRYDPPPALRKPRYKLIPN